MWRCLALVGSLSVASAQTALAEDWNHDANIGLAVEAFTAVYDAGGLEAAAGSVADCYRSVDAVEIGDRRLNRFEYCASLDFAGYLMDRRATEKTGTSPNPYFAVERIRERLERLAEWVDDPLTREQILQAWAVATAYALDAQIR